MTVKMFDKVRTKSGETGYIVEIYNDGEAYEIDLEPYDKSRDFPTKTIKKEDIIDVIE